jgi:hypothetical protein
LEEDMATERFHPFIGGKDTLCDGKYFGGRPRPGRPMISLS